MSDELKRIEAVLDEKVRPVLRGHGGDIQIDRFEDGVVYVKMLTVVEAELTAALPDLVRRATVVQTVSDELWEQAKRLLRDHHL